MLQDAVAAKQNDLSTCIKHRESKLRQLFRLTTRCGGDYNEEDEKRFLQANNIAEGRYFVPSTLPSFRLHAAKTSASQLGGWRRKSKELRDVGSPFPKSPDRHKSVESAVAESESSINRGSLVAADSHIHEHSLEQNGSPTLPGSLSQHAAETANVAKSTLQPHASSEALVDHATSTAQSGYVSGTEDPLVDTTEYLPLSSDEAGSIPKSAVQTIAAEQNLTSASTIHIPSKESQEQRTHVGQHAEEVSQQDIEDVPSLHKEQMDQGPEEGDRNPSTEETIHERLDNQNRYRSHGSQEEILPASDEKLKEASGQPLPGNVLRSQMDHVKADNAFAGTPSTPDEQLRSEEAQALEQSRVTSTTSEDLGKQESQSQEPIATPKNCLLQSLDDSRAGEQPIDEFATPFSSVKAQSSGPAERIFESNYSTEKPTPGLREHTFPGMTGSLSKDLTFSRRPPMRIDTGVPSMSESSSSLSNRKTTASGVGTPFTPSETVVATKSGPATSQVQSPPERMITRVSSGALRHKSVSEILGETPRHSAFHNDKASLERAAHADENTLHTPKSAASMASPDATAFRQRINRMEEKDRSKLSTVVFVRQPSSGSYRHGEPAMNQDSVMDKGKSEPKDYLLPLFAAQAAAPSQSRQLHSLLSAAHKTLTTSDHHTDFQEQQDCRILTRIYQLQSTNCWSLRQHERSVEPNRPKTHWDVLLSQMRWLLTDFREERKWKLAAAKGLADACAQWVASSTEERIALQVKVRSPSMAADQAPLYMHTPDLVPSRDDDSSDVTDFESPDFETSKRSAPARIFSLPPDMFVFGLDKTPIAEKILSELPLYEPSAQAQVAALKRTSDTLDDDWRTPVVPFSKFVEGKMVTREPGPPRKRSRFDYSDEQETSHDLGGAPNGSSEPEVGGLGPEQDNVALFRQENQHIRDRIHAGHAFRPPSEYLMPSQSFFESRLPSQWIQAEDDDLRRLVRDYAYNWSLISSCLSKPSLFSSGAERRTPWECFERWVSLEGLPAEMSKTQYFRAYQSRLSAAQKVTEAQQHAVQQQQQGNNAAQMPVRRRTTVPFLVDHRKTNKHLHLVDAMRKLAKKRENAAAKQQQLASVAAMRRQNEANQPRIAIHTPQEFSRAKWEREQKQQETARAYHQHVFQQRDKAKNGQRQGQVNGAPNMMPRPPTFPPIATGSSPSAAAAIPNGTTQTAPMSHPRPVPATPRMSNGAPNLNSVPSNSHGVPHAPMQPQMQIQQRVPAQMMSDPARIFQEATRLSEQQRYLATQTQHQHPQSNLQAGNSTSPNMSRVNAVPHHGTSLFGGIQGRSGSPSMNGGPAPPGSSASPRMANPNQPQHLSNGTVPVVNQIQTQVKARNPQASPEQINAMTTDTLSQYRMSHHAHVQAAIHAAAGSPGTNGMSHSNGGLNGQKGPSPSQQQVSMNGVNSRSIMSSHEYGQTIRSQQPNQQNRSVSSGGINAARTMSRSATPQTHPGHAPSQSPRPQTAGVQ